MSSVDNSKPPWLRNLIGISDPDMAIYRTFRLAHFRAALSDQRMALVAPALWEDPSENLVRKNPETTRNEAVNDEGVKVRSIAGYVLKTLWDSAPTDAEESCFLGAVRYLPQREAVQIVADEIGRRYTDAFASGRGHAESLLIKRAPFDHEREIRLIYVQHQLDGSPTNRRQESLIPRDGVLLVMLLRLSHMTEYPMKKRISSTVS